MTMPVNIAVRLEKCVFCGKDFAVWATEIEKPRTLIEPVRKREPVKNWSVADENKFRRLVEGIF